MFRALDVGQDAPAEAGDLARKQAVLRQRQVRAVGREAGAHPHGDAACQVPPVGRCPQQQDVRLAVHDDLSRHFGVAVGGVLTQEAVLGDKHLVGAGSSSLLGQARHLVPQEEAGDLELGGIGKLARLAQQLQRHALQLPLVLLQVDPDAAGFLGIV